MDMGAPWGWVLRFMAAKGSGCPMAWVLVDTGVRGHREPTSVCGMGALQVWVLMDIGAHGRGCPMARVSVSMSTHWGCHGCLAPSPQEHFNYYSLDPALGHLVFSLKYDEQEHLHLLLR